MKRILKIRAGEDVVVTIKMERDASSYGKGDFEKDFDRITDYVAEALLKKYHISEIKLGG